MLFNLPEKGKRQFFPYNIYIYTHTIVLLFILFIFELKTNTITKFKGIKNTPYIGHVSDMTIWMGKN